MEKKTTKLTLTDYGIKHKVSFDHSDVSASDLLDAFIGLMYSATFSEYTIRSVIIEKAQEFEAEYGIIKENE